MSSSENAGSPLKGDENMAVENRTKIDDVTIVLFAIKTEMKINIKDVNKGRLSPEDPGLNDARPVSFEIDD